MEWGASDFASALSRAGLCIQVTPTPYTTHHTPYTLHPAPNTLHPTTNTLHPTTLLDASESGMGVRVQEVGGVKLGFRVWSMGFGGEGLGVGV